MKLISSAQKAVIKKDMREAMSNKMVKITMIIVPLMMVLVMPIIFTCIAVFAPSEMEEFGPMIALLPIKFSLNEAFKAGYYYVMNYMQPMFFLMVPLMSASIAAGSSFVGEKERHTIETLLFSPLTVHQLFQAKVMGAVAVALSVTGVAFLAFAIVAVIGSVMIYGGLVLDIAIWLVIMLFIVPSISLAGVTVIVLASAKAKNNQEAQQYASLLIVPLMMVFILPQSMGLFLFDAPRLLIAGVVFLIAAVLLTRLASARFTPEKLLK